MRLEDIKQILLPFDFSAACEDALRTAGELARASKAKLELLHVYDTPGRAFGNKKLLVSSEKALAELEEYVTKKLEVVAERLVKDGVSCTVAVRQGSAHAEIVKYANETDASMIVMGTHGRGGFEYAKLGSVAERVVQRTPCPVLVVPSKKR